MNYEPNKIDWKQGDIVIHDGDAKTVEMLMVVKGKMKTKDKYLTTYIDQKRNGKKVYDNRKDVLHDPKRFKIEIPVVAVIDGYINIGRYGTIHMSDEKGQIKPLHDFIIETLKTDNVGYLESKTKKKCKITIEEL
jgi:hypothetical protein